MGVCIPNMEKPKSCGECKFYSGLGYGFHCYLNGKHITFIGEVEDFCPLIEIEEWNSYGHGKMYAPKGTFQAIIDDEEE